MKRFLCAILTAVLLLTMVSCGKKQEPEEVQPEDPGVVVVEPEPVLNPLTGLHLKNENNVNNRPVAVMLNNIHYAMPQHGVSDADIIFEFNVEGGITRMVGFFQEIDQIGTIGSVRSARACFVETVLGMDAIYAHAGGSAEAIGMISQLGIDDIDENYTAFWRDEQRAQTMSYEHTLMPDSAHSIMMATATPFLMSMTVHPLTVHLPSMLSSRSLIIKPVPLIMIPLPSYI